jgi:hypothetical protein
MNNSAETLVPVQLYSGLMDGFKSSVKSQPDLLDVYLFETRFAGYLYRLAYKPANRSTEAGKRWVLNFDCIVSKQKISNSEL